MSRFFLIVVTNFFVLSNCSTSYYLIDHKKNKDIENFNLFIQVPVILNDSAKDIIIPYDWLIEYLSVNTNNYFKRRAMVFNAISKNVSIEVSDSIKYYWVGEVIPFSHVDSVYNLGLDYFEKHYIKENGGFDFSKVKDNRKDYPYVLSILIKHEYYIRESPNLGGISISKYLPE